MPTYPPTHLKDGTFDDWDPSENDPDDCLDDDDYKMPDGCNQVMLVASSRWSSKIFVTQREAPLTKRPKLKIKPKIETETDPNLNLIPDPDPRMSVRAGLMVISAHQAITM